MSTKRHQRGVRLQALFSLLVLGFVIASGIYFFNRNGIQQKVSEEQVIRNTVQNFGQVLKSVSLLSPTVSQDIETNYEKFLTPNFLAKIIANPMEYSLGRKTSSPWPDRIEITKIAPFGSFYLVEGKLIELTSAEIISEGDAISSPIALSLQKIDNKWLIDNAKILNFKIEKILDVSCSLNTDCETPGEYLVQSHCPFTSYCLAGKCSVVCPSF